VEGGENEVLTQYTACCRADAAIEPEKKEKRVREVIEACMMNKDTGALFYFKQLQKDGARIKKVGRQDSK
jgi:hypothetical protein